MPTRRDDIADIADIAGIPRVVLGDDALDTLELVLNGALAALPLLQTIPSDTDVVLTDGENTPVAHVIRAGRTPTVRAVRPFARGDGPEWDSTIRRLPVVVRMDLRRVAGDGGVLGIVVDEVPTRADMRHLAELVTRVDPAAVVCAVQVGRALPSGGEVDAAGLTRVGQAVAAGLASGMPGLPIEIAAIPFPGRAFAAAAGVRVADVLSAYGATESVTIGSLRSPSEADRVAALPLAFERQVADLYPEAFAEEVLRARARGHRRGAMVLFTGLSGSGKSTIARALAEDLRAGSSRVVTLLDGDEVRRHLSADLGFDAGSRDRNIDRIAYVSALVADHGGIAIAAPIAPFAAARRAARELVEAHGAFLLVYVDTPVEVCEARDRKGLYARARAGEIADFTGISSPYEEPDDADVLIETATTEVADAVRRIRAELERRLEGADVDG